MAHSIIASVPPRMNWASAVIWAGFWGGALDFVDASVMSVVSDGSILRPWMGIAQVWLGKLPDGPNLPAALLGTVSHFAIAIIMAAVLALAMARLQILRRRPMLAGLAYGVGLYLVMLGIVLPVLVPGRFFLWNGISSLHGIAVHMAVGLLMAMVISRGLREPKGLQAFKILCTVKLSPRTVLRAAPAHFPRFSAAA